MLRVNPTVPRPSESTFPPEIVGLDCFPTHALATVLTSCLEGSHWLPKRSLRLSLRDFALPFLRGLQAEAECMQTHGIELILEQ